MPLTEELRRQERTVSSRAEVLGDGWPIYKHARLVFNSETLISYFQLIIVISGSTVEAGRDVGQWGQWGRDGGQARWMTQFTAVTLLWHRPARWPCARLQLFCSRWLTFHRFSFVWGHFHVHIISRGSRHCETNSRNTLFNTSEACGNSQSRYWLLCTFRIVLLD